jgi:hypothetical protein
MTKTIGDRPAQYQSTSTAFERQSKQGMLKDMLNSPYRRRAFADNEKGYEKFLNYHSLRGSSSNLMER